MNEWLNEWMSEWTSEWMNEWMNEWVSEWISTEHSLNNTDGKAEVVGEKSFHFHLIYRKSHMDWPGFEPRILQWKAGK
jgi:hypothetical protein